MMAEAMDLDLQDDFTSTNPEWKKVLALKSVADIQAAATQGEFWASALAAFAIAASPDAKASMEADLPYRESGGGWCPYPRSWPAGSA